MATPGTLRWTKSSYSGGSASDCVEVGTARSCLVHVRDSKRRTGPALRFAERAFADFLDHVKHHASS
ncbi:MULTISPECIES: DUF397 domain-containing protein [Streptomyces]|uniref:DUF397 domain-containing protein n=1 Tax=Streptomyces TaxID=1883 RepID=UPI00099BB994|nr:MULTISPECIES: DUF397 domain-containing protein [Streptomyces]